MPVLLLISYSGLLGGAERALLTFVTGLDGERWLACPEGPLAEAARSAGLRVAVLRSRPLELRGGVVRPARAVAGLLAHSRELDQLIGALAPDLLVANGMRCAIALSMLPARRRHATVVFLHHDMLPGEAIGHAVRRAADRADLVIVPSAAVADDLGARRAPLVIHPGVELERFDTGVAPVTPPEVLSLGALVGWKRLDVALDAIAIVRRVRPDVRLRVAGAAPLSRDDGLVDHLHERAGRADLAGAVEFLGAVDDPARELGRATCLLHCAEREPFGLAVAEALAAGRPAVVPDAAGPREIVDRSCGLLYPPGDAAAAAEALLSLLGDPDRAAALGTRGRVRAREQFGADAARAGFTAALAPLLAPGSAGSPLTDDPARAGARLTLVTVTYNSAGALEALLESVHRHLPAAEVIVVDNASRDQTGAVIERWRGPLALTPILLGENLGFGSACNRGVAVAGGGVTALLNPDVELVDDSLLALAAELMRAGAPERLLAPLVLSRDGHRQDTAHPLPCSAAELAHALVPAAALGGSAAAATLTPWRSRHPRPVGWAVGCALVARTSTLRRLGPFDQSIFLYAEDLDLCLRAREQGIETWFWPDARVLHDGGHSTRAAFGGEPIERLSRARHEVVTRRLGRRAARVDDATQALTFASRLALKWALGRDHARERSQLRAIAGIRCS